MKENIINKKIRWLEITNPSKKEIQQIQNQFRIHPLISDELLAPSDRAKIETYDNYVFIVYHLPIYNIPEQTSRRAEIDIIATKEVLITVTYETLEPVKQFGRDLEKRALKNIKSTAELIYYLLEEVNDFSLRQLKHVEKKVHYIGEQLFKRLDRKLLEDISRIKRDILDFSIIAASQRTSLESLSAKGLLFWGREMYVYFSDLLGDFLKVHYLLENLRATVESYSQTVSQLFGFKTSEIIRRFSILGFLTFPLILYSTIALQPTVEKTFIHNPADFWFIFGLILIIVIGLALIFKKKGWL